MNVSDAAYDTVHEYPGGSEPLAIRMNMSGAMLRGKVNPNSDRNRLALEEADAMMGKSGDFRILHALAANHGFTLQRTDVPATGSMIGALLAAAASKGDLSEIIAAAMADNRITPNEASDIARACAAVQSAIVEVSQHAEADASKDGAQ